MSQQRTPVTKAQHRRRYHLVLGHQTGRIGNATHDAVGTEPETMSTDWSDVSDSNFEVLSPQYSTNSEGSHRRRNSYTDNDTPADVSGASWSPRSPELHENPRAMDELRDRQPVAGMRIQARTYAYHGESYQEMKAKIVSTKKKLAATRRRAFKVGEDQCKLLTKNIKVTRELEVTQKRLEELDRFSRGQAIIIAGTRKERDSARADVLTRDREILRLQEKLLAARATTGRTMEMVFELKDELASKLPPSRHDDR